MTRETKVIRECKKALNRNFINQDIFEYRVEFLHNTKIYCGAYYGDVLYFEINAYLDDQDEFIMWSIDVNAQ